MILIIKLIYFLHFSYRQPQDDISLSLERLCHNTGGQSFFIPEESFDRRETELTTYVALVDAFREIQVRTSQDGPFLVG